MSIKTYGAADTLRLIYSARRLINRIQSGELRLVWADSGKEASAAGLTKALAPFAKIGASAGRSHLGAEPDRVNATEKGPSHE